GFRFGGGAGQRGGEGSAAERAATGHRHPTRAVSPRMAVERSMARASFRPAEPSDSGSILNGPSDAAADGPAACSPEPAAPEPESSPAGSGGGAPPPALVTRMTPFNQGCGGQWEAEAPGLANF